MKTTSMALALVPVLLVLAACAPAAGGPAPQPTPTVGTRATTAPATTPTAVPVTSVQRLEESVGAPPAAGWKWAVAEMGGADAISDGPHEHDYAWAFLTVQGSSEVSMGDGPKVLAIGEGAFIPAKAQHSHRYLPQSKAIGFHLRRGDEPPGALHRGRTLLMSDNALELRAGASYKLRIREFTIPPGGRAAESLATDANFGYVMEGTATLTARTASSRLETGKAFVLPHKASYTVSNESASPARFLLADVRP